MSKHKFHFDEIGEWSEVKLDIVREYAKAYSTIMSRQHGMAHYYIDGFAGSGVHVSKSTGDWIPGSPLNALNIRPSFRHHFLIDLDGTKIDHLKLAVGNRTDVTVLEGDCNDVLLHEVLPQVRYEDYRRALCLLDPYGLDLRWEVMATAGTLKTIDLFLNFPIMDMNRNALWSAPERVSNEQAAPMTAFWGDETWKDVAYAPDPQGSLFGEERVRKTTNQIIVEAFRKRLRKVGGFANVPQPMPMRNSTNAVVYYLFFASQNDTANKIVNEIFAKYRNRPDAT